MGILITAFIIFLCVVQRRKAVRDKVQNRLYRYCMK